MSRQINQPVGQIKLTNVAVVRCNKAGKRFEIACYRNKVMDYRAGLEKDLSEVLQAERIFTNVSKGQFAKLSDLKKAFGTADEEAIAKVILEQGKSIQVSDLERNQQITSTTAQIASWVAANCVHPAHGRPYTVSQIKHALGKNFTVQTHKPLKKQCLDAVKFLKQSIPIERAKMELSLQYPASQHSIVQQTVARFDDQTCILLTDRSKLPSNDDNDNTMCTMILQVDPALYRELDELAKSIDEGHLEILQQVVMSVEGDIDLDQEMERKKLQPTKEEEGLESVTHAVAQMQIQQPTMKNDNDDSDDSLLLEEQHRPNDASDNDDNDSPIVVDRKKQKKASKKAKKAQRRKAQESHTDEEEEDQMAGSTAQAAPNNDSTAPSSNNTAPPPAGSKSCNTCGGAFMSAADYRAHFRSDWHRFNQKLKLQGRETVSEEEFRLCDAETFFGRYDG